MIGGREGYDARKTDAWACGVVLYAIVARRLPFGEGVGAVEAEGNVFGGERGSWARNVGLAERRHWLMSIARGEWVWPGDEMGGKEDDSSGVGVNTGEEELVGSELVKSQGARRIVERLLVRDPRKRARIVDMWEDEWMFGNGIGIGGIWWRKKESQFRVEQEESSSINKRPMVVQDKSLSPPAHKRDLAFDSRQEKEYMPMWVLDDHVHKKVLEEPRANGDCEGEEEEEEGGCLFDQEGIDNVTRQEVL